jgi:hypothetical protein
MLKYLGVILDSKLNCNQHLQNIIRKTKTTFALVRHSCCKKWGLRHNTRIVHWLYISAIRPSIFHGALVWWPKVMQKTDKLQLSMIQKMTCLTITGAMKSTPNEGMEMLLNLTPLDHLIMAEVSMALCRLHILIQPADITAATDWGMFVRKPFWCLWRATPLRSVVLIRPSKLTRASSVEKIS